MLLTTVNRIKQKIQDHGLPGENAQHLMAPMSRRKKVENADLSKAKIAGVCILLYEQNGELLFPLMKRRDYKGVHSGQVSLPGGKQEVYDTSLEQTALRETHEEIGIHPSQVEILNPLTSLYIPPSNFNVQPYLAYTHDVPSFIPDPHEVEMLFSVRVDSLLNHPSGQNQKLNLGNGMRKDTPVYNLNDHIVWGATAMILSEFKELLTSLNN